MYVNTTADETNPSDGMTSLREAVAYANAYSNTSISFDASVYGHTITMNQGLLELSNTGGTTTIAGPAPSAIRILNAPFKIDSGVTAVIRGLRTNGGFDNHGSLSVTNCLIKDGSGY